MAICICSYIYVYMYMYIYVCICICIYIYMSLSLYINMSADAGSPSTSGMLANWNQPVDLTRCHCHHQECKTCPKLNKTLNFTLNVTKKTYQTINHSKEQITCHSQNLIYLLTCCSCSTQYVEETTASLNRRINIHRTAKKRM